jgi:hypothetical protein
MIILSKVKASCRPPSIPISPCIRSPYTRTHPLLPPTDTLGQIDLSDRQSTESVPHYQKQQYNSAALFLFLAIALHRNFDFSISFPSFLLAVNNWCLLLFPFSLLSDDLALIIDLLGLNRFSATQETLSFSLSLSNTHDCEWWPRMAK